LWHERTMKNGRDTLRISAAWDGGKLGALRDDGDAS